MSKQQPERSEEFKRLTILHQIEIVQTRIHQETGRIIKVPFPESEEDKLKLKEMYDRALAKYSS